jgi:hypothetical protein
VRKNTKGKFYYYGKAGMITPNRQDGQNWLKNNTEFFNAAEVKEVNESVGAYGRRFGEDYDVQMPLQQKQEGGGCLIQ